MSARVLVLGVGNPLLADEGVGLVALHALADRYRFDDDVELLDGGTAGLGLTAEIGQARKLLILDAVRAGREAGTVMRLDGASLPADFRKLSPHQVGIGEVLALSRLVGRPEEVVVLGVEPETTALSVGLSPAAERAITGLVEAAVDQLRLWGVDAMATEAGRGVA